MKRRDVLRFGLATAVLSALPGSLTNRLVWGVNSSPKRILYFSNSVGFEHDPVKIRDNGLSVSDAALKKLFAKVGIDVVCTKDGKVFDGDLTQYSCIAFYTSDDLLNGPNRMSPNGKKRFLAAIDDGVGFFGFHSSTDTWKTKGEPLENQTEVDPYISMLGGEFISHGPQQEAPLFVTQPAQIPWLKNKGETFRYFDEWYALKNFNKDMHVIIAQGTEGMQGKEYDRPAFPSTWARKQKKGRVMYCAMGHRNEFWEDDTMMEFIGDCFGWILGSYDMDITPNIDKVTPGAFTLKRSS